MANRSASKAPSLKTVAEAAGVSLTTVSNAYNKPEHLSPKLRERIFAIARRQGYSGPDPAARSLRSRRSGSIGVLLMTQLSYAFDDPYCVELLAGLAEVAENHRTSMVLIPLAPGSAAATAEEVRESVLALQNAVIDGAVADGIDDAHPALELLTSRGAPLVRSYESTTCRCVVIDEVAAGRSVGEHLAGLKHRDLGIIVDSPTEVPEPSYVDDESELYPYAKLRLAGIRTGVRPGTRLTVVTGGPNSTKSGRAAAEMILGQRRPPTAIVAISDVMALGALEALAEHHITVGEGGVSVASFDDVPAAAAANLTTVRQPVRDKGRLMGRMLLDASFTEERVQLPTELVIRSSTGLAPRTRPAKAAS
jgi:DNA-binding LacI/PurR family transcriptional regulator